MDLHHVRRGSGRPLLLVPGLGSTWASWEPVLDALAEEREVIAVDLPGFGDSPPLEGEPTVAALADALTAFLAERDLTGIDLVGSSLGARLVLELSRRGVGGAVVALDPGGFWNQAERRAFRASIGASIRLIRLLQPVMPLLTGNPVTRTALFAQLSARPWRLPAHLALRETRTFAGAPAFDATLRALVEGPDQAGAPAGTTPGPVVIGWGRRDLVCLPRQARRAAARFPGARVVWFDHCGHFPMWDRPEATTRLILEATGA